LSKIGCLWVVLYLYTLFWFYLIFSNVCSLKERAKKKELNQRKAGTEFSRKALKHKKMANSKCDISIVIDLSFDEHMIEKVFIIITNYKITLCMM
jgi:hypothetical protein